MNKKFISIFKNLSLVTIAGLFLFFAFKGINIKNVFQQTFRANMFWVAISGLISLIAFFIRAHRWNLLIGPMGYFPSLKTTTCSLMIGYFANLALPRLGEVSRCGALSKSESIPFNKLLGTVVIERIIDVISLFVCILLTASIEYKRLGRFFNEKIFDPLVEKFDKLVNSPVLLIAVVLLFVILIATIVYFLRRSRNQRAESAFNKIIKGFIDGLRSVANLKRPWLFIFESVFIWILYYLGVYVVLFAFPFTSQLGAGAALFLLVAGGLGMSAPVQGGIGAYHLLVSQGLMLYGISKEDGLAFATLLHSLQILLIIVLGIASLSLLFFQAKKNKTEQPVSA